ncbi:MAG TPA: ribosome biogenesis GTP-binding protein YihA/YsxC [Casimicrobiaceae bacterium]|nr:ribosome biogenesis GTP-binding protein YihA/YsxC [Casimicrobiaceae bacterium]
MKKRAIVAESPRPAEIARIDHAPGPLEGARFVTGAATSSQLPAEGAREIAFAGRSNAGKSSAINALARRSALARVSRTPGRTREINFFALRSGAHVVDLPGYGYAAVSKAQKEAWQQLLWSYVTSRTSLIGLVQIVDARHGLSALDVELLSAFLPSARPMLILATKIDKLNIAQGRKAVADIRFALDRAFGDAAGAVSVMGFSAATSQGVASADEVLARWLE